MLGNIIQRLFYKVRVNFIARRASSIHLARSSSGSAPLGSAAQTLLQSATVFVLRKKKKNPAQPSKNGG